MRFRLVRTQSDDVIILSQRAMMQLKLHLMISNIQRFCGTSDLIIVAVD